MPVTTYKCVLQVLHMIGSPGFESHLDLHILQARICGCCLTWAGGSICCATPALTTNRFCCNRFRTSTSRGWYSQHFEVEFSENKSVTACWISAGVVWAPSYFRLRNMVANYSHALSATEELEDDIAATLCSGFVEGWTGDVLEPPPPQAANKEQLITIQIDKRIFIIHHDDLVYLKS